MALIEKKKQIIVLSFSLKQKKKLSRLNEISHHTKWSGALGSVTKNPCTYSRFKGCNPQEIEFAKNSKIYKKNQFCVVRAKKSNNCCFIVSKEERIEVTSYLANMEASFGWFKKDNSKLTCLVTRFTSFMEVKSGGGFSWWDDLGKVTSDVNPATTFLQQMDPA